MSWSLRLVYAVGQLPEGVKSAAFGFFLLFYYNQVLGLSASLASAAIFIALCIDAVSDPIVGSWSDSAQTAYGRRHPFMYWSAVPFAAAFFGLFVPWPGLGETGLFFWLLGFCALTRTAMTFYTVPYMAMGAELIDDYDERTLLASLRTVFQLIGMFAVLIGGNQLFFSATDEFANGQLNPAAYPGFAFACVPFLLIGIWLAAAGTHGQIPRLSQPVQTSRLSVLRVMREIRVAFRIPSFTALVVASVMFGITQGMVQALILYTATYFFELSQGELSFLFAVAVVGIIVGSLCSRPVAYLISEKRMVFAAGLAWYAFFTSIVIILRLVDVLPGNEHPIVAPLYIASGFVSALGLGVAIPMIGSMIADVTDEHERRHQDRQEGIYYAAASFAGKVVGGAGPVFAGIVIDLAGIAPGSAASEVDPDAIFRFGLVQGPAVILLTLTSIVAVGFYRITRQRHREILDEIRQHEAPSPRS